MKVQNDRPHRYHTCRCSASGLDDVVVDTEYAIVHLYAAPYLQYRLMVVRHRKCKASENLFPYRKCNSCFVVDPEACTRFVNNIVDRFPNRLKI